MEIYLIDHRLLLFITFEMIYYFLLVFITLKLFYHFLLLLFSWDRGGLCLRFA